MYDLLLSPMKIGSMTVKNRTVMTAAEFSLGQTNGKPTERLMDYYEERAKGGVGMIIPGICRVNDMGGASTFTQLAMSHDYHIAPMHEFAERLHRHGAKLCIQLHHPGRQGMASAINSLPLVIPIADRFPGVMDQVFKCTPLLLGMEAKGICFSVQAPSKVELAKHGATRMHAMSKKEIRDLIDDFIEAAVRCQKAGVDCVELHAGHGYIIQQFLSPHTNRRTDEYGGSFDKRLRFLTEIIQGIRARCGRDYPLTVRLTADEMYARVGRPGVGYDLETGKQIAKRLEELTVDAINVTSACYDAYNYWLEPTSFEPGWRKYLAREIKSVVSIPVIAANVIRTPEQAERQLEEGDQDFVASARTFICDPHWVEKAASGHPEDIRRCIGCLNCIRSFMTNAGVGRPGECALNMSVAREKEYFNMARDGEGRKILVIGAGPAGLTAALHLAMRGFDVSVYEKAEKAGGQVITAAACHLKDKLYWCIEDLMTAAKKAGAQIFLSTELSARQIADMDPWGVVVATGGEPIRPRSIEGLDRENVFTAPQIIHRETVLRDQRVVVAGSGMTGLETAEILCETGNSVTVIEMADEIAPGNWFQLTDDEMERLAKTDTKFLTGTKLLGADAEGVTVEDVKTGERRRLEADSLVLSLGVKPAGDLARQLDRLSVRRIWRVGDAQKSGTIADACHSAFDTVMKIK
ncbi:MAG: FAD-dependent oxidoreductase [Oscillospiraceae bacterium]|nr:FAD-dependent oxidoreductase [Oscillospiraceae bacterium]